MYTLEEVSQQNESVFFTELEQEIREEIEEKGWEVKSIEFFITNPNGIVKIKFLSGVHAEEFIGIMEGRFFDGRRLEASFWDGKTDFKKETGLSDEQRIDQFGAWLENENQ